MSITPKPPKTLGPFGRCLWRRVAGDVQPGWLLDERDLALLLAACQ
jgi:phage terminase small subunit